MRILTVVGASLLLAVNAYAQIQAPDYTDSSKWRCTVCENVSDLSIKGSDQVVMYDRYAPAVMPDHPTSLVVIYRPINLSVWNNSPKADVVRAGKLSPWLLIHFTLEAGNSEVIYILEQAGPFPTPSSPGWQLVKTVSSFEEMTEFLKTKYNIEQK